MIERKSSEALAPGEKEPRRELFRFIDNPDSVGKKAIEGCTKKDLTTGIYRYGKGERAQFWEKAHKLEDTHAGDPRGDIVKRAQYIVGNTYPYHQNRYNFDVAVHDGRIVTWDKETGDKFFDGSLNDRDEWAKEHAEEVVSQFEVAMGVEK